MSVNPPKRRPSLRKLKSLRSLGDDYYIQEIKDHKEDGVHDWNKINQKLFGEHANDDSNDDDDEEDKHRKWTEFEEHIKFTYLDFEMKEQNSLLSYPTSQLKSIPSQEDIDTINKYIDKHSVIHLIDEILSIFNKGITDEKKSKSKPDEDEKATLKTVTVTVITTNDDKKAEQLSSLDIIKREIQSQMKEVLGNRTNDDDYSKESCCSQNVDDMDKIRQLTMNCEPLKRIKIVLYAYHRLLEDKSSWNEIDIADIIQVDMYGHQQIFDDFLHIKDVHIDPDNDVNRSYDHDEHDKYKHKYDNIAAKICEYFEEECECIADPQECAAFTRHYRERTNDEREHYLYFQKSTSHDQQNDNNDDIAFQQECDKIHSYFFHSTIKFGTEWHQTTAEQETMIDNINQLTNTIRFSKSHIENVPNNMSSDIEEKKSVDPKKKQILKKKKKKIAKKTYVGKKEDNLWWNDVDPQSDHHQSEDEIYRILVKNMGVFRWQNPQGFKASQNRGISHYKPKYKNIKEEVMFNKYERVSKDNWKQTLKRSKIFFKSWARQKIRTRSNGYFDDQLTRKKEEWKVGTELTFQETVILKLYTDFDKLQFALKKCFRFETFDDIFDDVLDENEVEKRRKDLKDRLESFYHWRGGLLLVLNKFGTKLNHENNMVLYHGVNAKMIIQPSQTLAFNGPLSTSSSYHVARTFATRKGMVLKITSHFPRLNFCNAFDVSPISDFPEEQEWLIGFMYVRLLKITTQKLVNNVSSFPDLLSKVPLSSWVRQQFFAIHLFNEQIFSMSDHLERMLAQFLKVNRKECCDENQREKYKDQHGQFKDWDLECCCHSLCKIADQHNWKERKMKKKSTINDKIKREHKILPILWKKFTEFREEPNLKQRIKFDIISDHLKRFFMESIEDKQKWVISFDEITTVYPKIQEIHFINKYKFDHHVLQRLIKQIKRKGNKIRKIVFLYYNYKEIKDDTHKPQNREIFYDPDHLDDSLKKELEVSGWKIRNNKNGATGYKIRIYDNKNI